MIQKLIFPPDQSSYSVTDGTEVLSVQLDGGASRFRQDILNANCKITVQWTLDRDKYAYIKSFYKYLTMSGALPFLLDLYIDNPYELTEHVCHFVPGTFGLKSQSGLAFVVSAQIEAIPVEDQNLIDFSLLYGLFTDEYQAYVDAFNELMNVDIPFDMETYELLFSFLNICRTDWQGKQEIFASSRTNLCLYSQEFENAAWAKVANGTAVLPTVIQNNAASPDGTFSADLCNFNRGLGTSANDICTISRTTAGCTVGLNYSASIWLKSNTGSNQQVMIFYSGLTGSTTSNVYTVTQQWQRFSFSAISSSTNIAIQFGCRGAAGNTVINVLAWGAQLEQSSIPSSYMPTQASAVTAIDYNSPTPGIIRINNIRNPILTNEFAIGDGINSAFNLITPNASLAIVANIWKYSWDGRIKQFSTSRTNLLKYSQDFSNSAWAKTGVTGTQRIYAPDVTLTAWELTGSTSNNAFVQSSSVTANSTYVSSIWLKVPSGTLNISIYANDNGTGAFLKSVTLTTNWQRFEIIGTISATGTTQAFQIGGVSTWGAGVVIHAWGAQKELGTIAGAYIPTTSASASLIDYTQTLNTITFTNIPYDGDNLEWDGYYMAPLPVGTQLSFDATYTIKSIVHSVTNVLFGTCNLINRVFNLFKA